MRTTKAMLEARLQTLNQIIHDREREIESLKGQLRIYDKFTLFFSEGCVAIERTNDAISHVLNNLLRK